MVDCAIEAHVALISVMAARCVCDICLDVKDLAPVRLVSVAQTIQGP